MGRARLNGQGGFAKINGSITTTAKYVENIERGDLITLEYPLATSTDSFWDGKLYNVFSQNGEYLVSYKYSVQRLELYSVSDSGKTLLASTTDIVSNDSDMSSKLAVSNNGVAFGTSTSLLFRGNTKVPVDIIPSGTVGTIAFDDTGDWLYVPHTASPFLSVYKWDGSKYKKILNLDELPTSGCYSAVYSNGYIYVGHSSTMKLLAYKKEGENLIKKPINVTGYGTERHVKIVSSGGYLAAANGQSHSDSWTNLILYKLDVDGLPIESKLVNTGMNNSNIVMSKLDLVACRTSEYAFVMDVRVAFESGGSGSTGHPLVNAAGKCLSIDNNANTLVLTERGSSVDIRDLSMCAKKQAKFSYALGSTTMGLGVARDKGLINETKKISLFLRRG